MIVYAFPRTIKNSLSMFLRAAKNPLGWISCSYCFLLDLPIYSFTHSINIYEVLTMQEALLQALGIEQ